MVSPAKPPPPHGHPTLVPAVPRPCRVRGRAERPPAPAPRTPLTWLPARPGPRASPLVAAASDGAAFSFQRLGKLLCVKQVKTSNQVDESEEKFKKGERGAGGRSRISVSPPTCQGSRQRPPRLAAHHRFKAGADRIWQPETHRASA